jgi:hypothetical protein
MSRIEIQNKGFTSAGFFLKHSDTNSFIGLEKCSSSCILINIIYPLAQKCIAMLLVSCNTLGNDC